MKLTIHNSQTGNLIEEKSKTYSKMKFAENFEKHFEKISETF
jgi:hypothetical protein